MEYSFSIEFINGLKVGIEHISNPEEDEGWLIAIDLLFFRVGVWYTNPEDE